MMVIVTQLNSFWIMLACVVVAVGHKVHFSYIYAHHTVKTYIYVSMVLIM